MMRERPILFSAPMVRAILDGTKTQTRRVVKPQPYLDRIGNACWNGLNFGQSTEKVPHFKTLASPLPSSKTGRVHCPYGRPGDRLWVREAWTTHKFMDAIPPRDLTTTSIAYVADGKIQTGKYRQAFHMPRRYSRITLEITGVRVELLQDISYEDARAEGIDPAIWPGILTHGYKVIWQSINGPDSWASNPWVWVVEFKRVEQPA